MANRTEELNEIAAQVGTCTRCPLYKSATHAVPGEGPADAEIMLIGEAPGFHEDQQGRPFVGASGKFLDELLAQIGLKRSDTFITNVVKHRPPENRDPSPEEIEACRVWLDQQIKVIKPRVIVTVGRYAMARWFPNEKITVIHGKAKRFGNLMVVPMFHPAAALRNVNLKPVMIQDFKKLPKYIEEAKKSENPPSAQEPGQDDPPIQQLKMF